MGFFEWMKRREEIDQDVAEEIRSHLAMAAREHAAEGEDPETARLAARREFGNVTLAIEDSRLVWKWRWMEAARDFLKDVRYAVRVLQKSPAFSLIVIGVLAAGIGMNAVVFTLFKALALQPIPGAQGSGRLAVVMSKTNGGGSRGCLTPISCPCAITAHSPGWRDRTRCRSVSVSGAAPSVFGANW
jgi:hypothetical protein